MHFPCPRCSLSPLCSPASLMVPKRLHNSCDGNHKSQKVYILSINLLDGVYNSLMIEDVAAIGRKSSHILLFFLLLLKSLKRNRGMASLLTNFPLCACN